MRALNFPRSTYIFGILAVLTLPMLLLSLGKGLQSHLSEHHHALEIFMRGSRLDGKLDQGVLLARSFLSPNYDSLAETSQEAGEFCNRLSEATILASKSGAFAARYSDFCSALAAKISAVESFKLKNSVIQNSLKFLPTTIEQAKTGTRSREVHELYIELLRYTLEAKPELYKAALGHLENLRPSASRDSTLDTMLSHTRIVLESLHERHVIEEEILNRKVADKLKLLRSSYLEFYEREEREALGFRISLFALTMLLAGMLFALFARLQSTRDKLSILNQSLEERVASRTRELSTALRELELKQDQLMHASRLSALGEMAGGIAHEINSPLSAISLHAELLESSLPKGSALLTPVLSIQATVVRISKIIQGLKRFSHGGKKGDICRVSVGEIVADTLSFCGEKLKNSFVELRWQKEGEQDEFSCQPEQISQVLLNLINNAVDAVSDCKEKWVRVSSERRGGHIYLYVEDSGPEIPEEVRQKMMVPFFTTKAVGQGTGLGLSISRTIVENHGGKLSLDSASKRTRFIVELPA